MPFGGYADFDACVSANQDASDPQAYCASIMHQVEGKSEDGYALSDLPEEAQKEWIATFKEAFGKNDESGSAKIAWATVMRRYERNENGTWTPMKTLDDIQFKSILKEDRVVFGAASVAVVDSDNELITEDALRNAFKSYINRGEILFYHKNVPIGRVLPEYKSLTGKAFVSEVKGKELNIVAQFYKDTDIANEAWDGIESGELRSFSIGGKVKGDPVKVCIDAACTESYNRIDNIDLHEISVVPNPANPASVFTIIKSKTKDPDDPAEKLRRLEALIADEKTKALNCPTFTEKALEIIKGGIEMAQEDKLKELTERIVKLEARKEEHAGGCPEGHHMVDGECVPLEKQDECPEGQQKVDGKCVPMEEKSKEGETKADPLKAVNEIDSIRAQVAELKGAMAAITSATKEVASVKESIRTSPESKEAEEKRVQESGPSVTFNPDAAPIHMSDFTGLDSKGGDFTKRLERMAVEFGASKVQDTPDGKAPDARPPTEMESLKTDLSKMTKDLKTTMDEIKALREKAEISKVRAELGEVASLIKTYRNEFAELKENLEKTPQKVTTPDAPETKRTIQVNVPGEGAVPFEEVMSLQSNPRDRSLEAIKRRMEKDWGLTQ